MVLIADTGPVLSFARAHCFALLREVMGTLIIPEAVYNEIVVQGMGRPGAEEVRGASWITRACVADRAFVDHLPQSLNRGEREALALARERGGTVLVDDRDARRVAAQQGIATLGSLRLLQEAKQRGMIPAVKPILDALLATGTYISDTLYRSFLRDMGEE
jgi:predicted nucleic acid-binding protein